MKFVIKRSEWLRGEGGGASFLLRDDGKRCCIGFCCKQLGVHDKAMRGIPGICGLLLEKIPLEVRDRVGAILDDGFDGWVDSAYGVNDNPRISDIKRESTLKELAASAGHEFEFID